MHDLQLADFAAYRARLEDDRSEWEVVDRCCHITISRFFRDRGVFEALRRRVLSDIAARARQEGRAAQIWSAGCAAGEEPYTLKILWDVEIASLCPDVPLIIVATDIDEIMSARAQEGCFAATSLRELPPHLIRAKPSIGSGPASASSPAIVTGCQFPASGYPVRRRPPLCSTSSSAELSCLHLFRAYGLQEEVLAKIADRLPADGCVVNR